MTKLKAAVVSTVTLGLAATATHAQSESWQLKDPPMATRWAADVDPEAPLPEYPRPQLTRDDWHNLNGLWNYAVVTGDAEPDGWDGQILVPYPIESALSGVKREITADDTLYYERTFSAAGELGDQRLMLHFGAVDYRCEVFVNGQSVGTHQGGYDPFSFDITDALDLDGDGEQTLRVKVTDPTWTEGIPRGKQTLNPAGIMYTPTSGIWQTVWLEPVNGGGIEDLHIVPDVEAGVVNVSADLYGDAGGTVTVKVDGGGEASGAAGETIAVPLEDAELWTPDNPHLYAMTVTVERDGETVDEVGSYFGMRSVSMKEVDGSMRLTLNGEPIFHFGPLDQGFWPDGVYTAPTDEALRFDLEATKALGFNMTRKHIKVEPARWYYHADQLGLMVWQDMPSINSYDANDVPSGFPEIDKAAFERELRAMIDALENHPSIVMWVIYNESQGQHDTAKYVELVESLDPSRLVNQASGGRHEGVGDIYDHHPYPAPRLFDHPDDMAFVLGEYGGIGLKASENNPWQSRGWGYTTTEDGEELENLYASYADMIKGLRDDHDLAAAVYTQITDVEIEINGLLTYDRQYKVDPEWIAKANRFEWAGATYETVLPVSSEEPQEWRYTFRDPGGLWMRTDYDDSDWQTGLGIFGDANATRNFDERGWTVNTEWTGERIWLRKEFEVGDLSPEQIDRLVIRSIHDDDLRVFVNGILAFDEPGARDRYEYRRLSEMARKSIVPNGTNVLAVHCVETGGDQQVDVGLSIMDPNRD